MTLIKDLEVLGKDAKPNDKDAVARYIARISGKS